MSIPTKMASITHSRALFGRKFPLPIALAERLDCILVSSMVSFGVVGSGVGVAATFLVLKLSIDPLLLVPVLFIATARK